MTPNLKAMIVVMAIAAIVLYVARPIALRFATAADFRRRCAVWFAICAAGFLSPNFWWFVCLAAPLLLWGGLRDSNPVAFYLFLFQVVPSIFVDIPVVGINRLFQLDIYRLMSLCILIPALWRLRRPAEVMGHRRFELADLLMLGYGVLQMAFYVRPDLATDAALSDSFTNGLRRAFLYCLDAYLIYFVVSRYCSTRARLVEAMAALCLCCVVEAPMAVFESLRHWLLYGGIATQWSADPTMGQYLMRDHVLRAQAASGGPLVLGYVLAIGCALWLYLSHYAGSVNRRSAALLALWAGLLAAYSRGPWIGAVAIYLAYALVAPRRLSTVLKMTGVLVLLVAALLMTPFGERVVASLPLFGGSVDSGNYLYRQRLLSESWQIIQQHPWLGDRFAYAKLGVLRQGQGIIDLVNTYLQVTLFYGFLGLALFLGFILSALLEAYRITRRYLTADPDLSLLGAALVACIVGTLVMLANCSFILAYGKLYYLIGGLAIAYARLGALQTRWLTASAAGLVPTPAMPRGG